MLVGNKVMTEEKVKVLLEGIKKKKELQEISDDFVRDYLYKFFEQNHQVYAQLNKEVNPKSVAYKKTIKEVRSKLRRSYGLFRIGELSKKREELVAELLKNKKQRRELLKAILSTHSSTQERLSFYSKLYEKLFKITKKPQKILDLGCGINPFSIPEMKLRKLEYHAYDLSEEELNSLNKFFELLHKDNSGFVGKAENLDLLDWVKLKRLRKVDLCFLFKMTDVLDQGRGHKVSEAVISKIPAHYVIVSFPTLTMSGKKMNFPRRKWIELMCKRLGFKYKLLSFSNELFYVITK